MNRFSELIQGYINFYRWQMNIRSVNLQYFQNLRGHRDSSLAIKINDYYKFNNRSTYRYIDHYKFYNWRKYCNCARHNMGFYSQACIAKAWWGYKINVRNAFSRKKDECRRDQGERIKHECPDLPQRYFYSVLPSDIEPFRKSSLTKRFSPLIRGYIGFYSWKINIEHVNRQYLQNFSGFGWGSPLNFLSTNINGYYKNYNWRPVNHCHCSVYDKINVGNSFGTKNYEFYQNKLERVRRECPDLPKRYWRSVLPSDLSI